jgi:hypothetical protein
MEGTRFQNLVGTGLSITTTHLGRDFEQLRSLDRDWKDGKFFATWPAVEKIVSRTKLMWFEADKYLELSSELRRAKIIGGERALVNEPSTSALAESTLDLATRVLTEFKRIQRPVV